MVDASAVQNSVALYVGDVKNIFDPLTERCDAGLVYDDIEFDEKTSNH